MTAASQLNRIVQLIAEASRLPEGAETPVSELATRFGVTAEQIHEDVRVLTLLGEQARAEWLLSLEVWQEQDRVHVASRGPWRRPLRLTPDEMIALKIALAADPDAEELLAKLTGVLGEAAEPAAIRLPGIEAEILDRVRDSIAAHRRLEILYAGEGHRAAKARVIEPHQLFVYGGFWYCVAWCESAGAWRHFRLDRMVDARLAASTFEPRDDIAEVLETTDVFHGADSAEDVRVRFTPRIARWVKERYPKHEAAKGGAVDVVFRAGNPQWLARHVLQYGAEAEVIEPKAYREAVRKVVVGA